MDEFIKNSLDEHYQKVKARLEEYRGAIENMVALLYEKENITGEEVRDIIVAFEKEHGIASKVQEHSDEIKKELEDDAKMSKHDSDENEKQDDTGSDS